MDDAPSPEQFARDARWLRLHDIIEQRSLLHGDFRLSSGRSSKFLFQLRQTSMLPEGQQLIGTLIDEFMASQGIETVGGLVIGAVPIVCATAFASRLSKRDLDAFFVRKESKPHGAEELVDGAVEDGAEVLLVDDVATTGGSFLLALKNLNLDRTCVVKKVLCVVDRLEGAREMLGEHGIELVSIFTKADFGL